MTLSEWLAEQEKAVGDSHWVHAPAYLKALAIIKALRNEADHGLHLYPEDMDAIAEEVLNGTWKPIEGPVQ